MNEVPSYIDIGALEAVQAGERILDHAEIALYVGPIYNAANLTEDSTQADRHAVFVAALGKAIGDSETLKPRSHPELGWVLTTTLDPPASCGCVLAGSADDLSGTRLRRLVRKVRRIARTL